MISNWVQKKGILAKLLEKGIKIILKKECKKIGKIKIDIIATSIQIIKGIIRKIYIIAEEVNYKDLLLDKIELEANEIKITFKIDKKELKFENEIIIKFKLSLSEISMKKILFSDSWNWIGEKITKKVSNQSKLEDIEIKKNQLLIKVSRDKKDINEEVKIDIKTEDGKIYLENKTNNKTINIPIEDKVYIKNITIENNLIVVLASSSISF